MARIEDSYSFSDDFIDALIQRSEGQQSSAPQAQDETSDETPEPVEDDGEDWQSKYEELKAENESLSSQLSTYSLSDNPSIQSDDLLSYNDEGNGRILNMVLSDNYASSSKSYAPSNQQSTNPDLAWINKKSPNVNLNQTDSRLSQYLNSLPPELKNQMLATSGNDQGHVNNSLHYQNKAVDLRYQPGIHEYIKNDPLARQMGISVLDPDHGTAKHTHVQVREYGGGDGTDLWSTNKQKFVDSTLQANKHLEFIDRLYNGTQSIQVPGQKYRSTHLMSYDPQSKRVYPEIVNINGKLQYLGEGDASYDYADRTGEFIQFKTAEQAKWFSNSPDHTTGYKMGTGVLNSINDKKKPVKMKKGGKYKV